MTTAAASALAAGMSVFDHRNPDRARLVYSVTTLAGAERLKLNGSFIATVLVRYGHPSQGQPEPDARNVGKVPADRVFEVVADATGQRV